MIRIKFFDILVIVVKNLKIPEEVSHVLRALQQGGFEAYIVGGCVRDILRGEKPKDWDVTTSAKPEEIQKIFPESFYENAFLTVTVKTGSEDSTLKEIEITTYRTEGKYSDKRHPDAVSYAKTLQEDLARRDFTMNAIAISPGNGVSKLAIVDPFHGQKDLAEKILRSVGDPEQRFSEDALRMMRAVRFAVEFGFDLEEKTKEALKNHAGEIQFIAKERVRDELVKIIGTPRAKDGIELLHEFGLLRFIIPELEEGIGVENRPRIFTIWEHNLKALEYGAKKNFPIDVRIAAMLHDAGKPHTKGPMKNGEWTFYGHDVVGGRMAAQILERLHFSKAVVEKIATLIRWHLFKYDPEEGITDSSIRRLIRSVGAENMDDLVRLRICDRMGMGVPKALPYRLRHFQFRVEKILREEEAPTPKMLEINGTDIMNILGIPPGPKIGKIIEVLLQDVIDDPARNTRDNLEHRAKELGVLSDNALLHMAEDAESKVEMIEDQRISGIKSKYYVK